MVAILHNKTDGRKNEAIVQIIDGKQRLLTVQKFLHNEFSIPINGREIYFRDFNADCIYFFRQCVDTITATIFYSFDNTPFSDVEKIELFNFYNFSGTPQTEEHKNRLISLLKKENDIPR